MSDLSFNDRTIPPGGVLLPTPQRPLRRLNLLVTLEDLGEVSFYPFIMVLAGVMLTPLGNYTPVVWGLALCIVLFALQLLLRYPHVVLPELLRDLLSGNQMFQRLMRAYANFEPRRASNGKPTGHWITFRPFDIVPKVMLLISGAALPFAISVPYMTGALAAATIVLCAGLTLRSALLIVAGALLISASSILPAFNF